VVFVLKAIPVIDAVGMVLGHDVTRIIPGKEKGPAFRRGHIIQAQDIPDFLDIGKEHIYVFDFNSGLVHEDEAAARIAKAAAGKGLKLTEVKEGRINLISQTNGILKINTEALTQLNSLGQVVFSTLHTNQQISPERAVAGTRVIPLVIDDQEVKQAERICLENYPLIRIEPFKPFRVGVVTTGSEVYSGRIKDAFGPVIKKKFKELGSHVFRQILVSDDVEMTVDAIQTLLDESADMIVLTGGMSVDPDDLTPTSIRKAGGEVVTYGAPTFPGAMFMLAHINGIPVAGLPGCVMYHRASIFDLVIPRILAGETIKIEDIASLGHGGFCESCTECKYPQCGFGKG
jgi:molybdenum cofactor synthesis domain-containing protein